MKQEKLNEYALNIIFAIMLTGVVFLGIKQHIPFIATAFAASAYLAFINPYSKYSTPWNIGVSYIIAAIYGMLIRDFIASSIHDLYYIIAIFITFALFAETLTFLKAEHPPAAAVLLSFIYTQFAMEKLHLFACLIIILIILDMIFEYLLKHKKQILDTTTKELKYIKEIVEEDIDRINHNYKNQKLLLHYENTDSRSKNNASKPCKNTHQHHLKGRHKIYT